MTYLNARQPIRDVFLYIRQSTDEAAKRQVRSMSDQQRECEQLAERLNLNIVAVFREDQSAKNPHRRPVFKAMLKELSYKNPMRRRADGILAWHPDRLSRNALEAGIVIQMLDDNQIRDMFFPAYSFHNDASGKEHLFIEFARAKGYSDHLSVSVKRGTYGREREGAMVYPIKFGYRKRREVPENPALCSLFPVPDPNEYPVLKRIFALRQQGHSLDLISQTLKDEGLRASATCLGKSRLAKIVSDPFYFGKWIVNAGRDNERVHDLLALHLHDGTKFQPVISETAFWNCQSQAVRHKQPRKRIRHINPIYAPVLCDQCQAKMRPCWRKVKRAGGIFEDQLGFECQTRDENGIRCKQSRIKVDILYQYVAEAFQQVSFNKKQYHRFLIGADAFIKRKTATLKKERARQTKAVTTFKSRKLDLLRQKAILTEEGSITQNDIDLLNQELKSVEKQLQRAQRQQKDLSGDIRLKTIRFQKFIELSQSLHQHWLEAGLEKKRKISEKILLNLTIDAKKIRSQTWKEPFLTWLERPEVAYGRGQCTNLEPWLERLWNALEEAPENPDGL